MFKFLKRYSTYTLLVALIISAISAYYSIVGLTAIFAAAVVPIIIMGAALELGKLTAAVWLKLNWHRAPLTYKFYLVPAVAFLMLLTSMGIFGFLSKAHSDQSLVSGDSQAKISVYDEKIKISKENIDVNRKALKQMDEAVDQIMGRSTTETGADKAVAVRRAQQKERGRLLTEIEAEQKKITALNEQRAPIAAEVRKVEAEVGPIKYIAALIYGDDTDTNMLEAAVRWVIILIVAVFDPLALVLILAAQQSMKWEREEESTEITEPEPDYEQDDGALTDLQLAQINSLLQELPVPEPEIEIPPPAVESDPTINCYKCGTELINATGIGLFCPNNLCDVKDDVTDAEPTITTVETVAEPVIRKFIWPELEPDIQTANVTVEKHMFKPDAGYVSFEGKQTSIEALRGIRPDLILPAGSEIKNKFDFGSTFPPEAYIGDLYMRTDVKPNRLLKFNGAEWIQVNKQQNTSYLQNLDYLKFLIDKLSANEYLPEMLTEQEEEEIKLVLNK